MRGRIGQRPACGLREPDLRPESTDHREVCPGSQTSKQFRARSPWEMREKTEGLPHARPPIIPRPAAGRILCRLAAHPRPPAPTVHRGALLPGIAHEPHAARPARPMATSVGPENDATAATPRRTAFAATSPLMRPVVRRHQRSRGASRRRTRSVPSARNPLQAPSRTTCIPRHKCSPSHRIGSAHRSKRNNKRGACLP